MTLEEMKKRIKENDETKSLELSDSDILIVNRYLDLKDKIVDGYKVSLQVKPYIEIIYQPTEEKLDNIAKDKFKNHLQIFNTDVYLQEASLRDFKLMNQEREDALNELISFVENYDKSKYSKGYYICGKYGTGKTYLISAVAQELVKKRVDVLMVFMPDLVRTVRSGIKEGDLENKINQLKQVEVLILDDIGGENMTPWFRDEILLPVLQYRLSARLTTFFTSNLPLVNLAKSLSNEKNNEMDYIKAYRVIQRIKDLTILINLDQEQYQED